MTISKILIKEKINIELLNEVLILIGLNLSEFDNIENKLIPDDLIQDLTELFKLLIIIDPYKTTQITKDELC